MPVSDRRLAVLPAKVDLPGTTQRSEVYQAVERLDLDPKLLELADLLLDSGDQLIPLGAQLVGTAGRIAHRRSDLRRLAQRLKLACIVLNPLYPTADGSERDAQRRNETLRFRNVEVAHPPHLFQDDTGANAAS